MAAENDDLESWRRHRVVALAIELAESGHYHDFADIDFALRFEQGWTHACAELDTYETRRKLNRLCAVTRDAKAALHAASLTAPTGYVVEGGVNTRRNPASLLRNQHRISNAFLRRLYSFRPFRSAALQGQV
ncbi:hypothetical protein [Paraburkholderia hospita]|uniref:hypothetical protein n=1 Tax=Paraburkholderia hospita TaxID=169430 RepID=UPI000DEEEB2D|nr:hypothetical protein [Paraburkholderia hospita]AXF06253.1 hypothetical protein CUJ88_49390 [Paraburkholderia hospita]